MVSRNPDSRIPIVFSGSAGADDVILVEGDLLAPDIGTIVRIGSTSHYLPAIRCACCSSRGALENAFMRLFLDRARGGMPYFQRVLVIGSVGFEDVIRSVVSEGIVVRSRYRLSESTEACSR